MNRRCSPGESVWNSEKWWYMFVYVDLATATAIENMYPCLIDWRTREPALRWCSWRKSSEQQQVDEHMEQPAMPSAGYKMVLALSNLCTIFLHATFMKIIQVSDSATWKWAYIYTLGDLRKNLLISCNPNFQQQGAPHDMKRYHLPCCHGLWRRCQDQVSESLFAPKRYVEICCIYFLIGLKFEMTKVDFM